MHSTITEAELYTIILTYGDIIATRIEIFVGGSIAMIVAIFIARNTLTIYLRAIIIILFSLFSYNQYFVVMGFTTRTAQIIESIRIVTADQAVKLPMTVGILANPTVETNAYFSATSYIMILTWLCCVGLTAFPKLLVKQDKK